MDDHSHAVTVPEGFTYLDFPAEAVAFCAAGYYFVFKLDAKLAPRLFSTRQQFRAVASDLPRQIAKRFSIGRRNVKHGCRAESPQPAGCVNLLVDLLILWLLALLWLVNAGGKDRDSFFVL